MGLSFLSTAALLSRVSKDGHKSKDLTVTPSLRGFFEKVYRNIYISLII